MLSILTHTLYLFFCGICMGTADLIPGISGGTVAFMMGFYDDLITSLKTFNQSALRLLITGKWRTFCQVVAWRFLIPLLCGILFAFFVLANFFHFILAHESYRVYLYAGFLGLILASFVFCLKQVRVWKWMYVAGMCVGSLVAYALTDSPQLSELQGKYAVKWQQEATISLINYDPASQMLTHLSSETLAGMLAKGLVNPHTLVYDQTGHEVGLVTDFVQSQSHSPLDGWLICCGAIAVCALLLPGISGSYLLTLLGVYPSIIGALAEFIAALKQGSFDQEAFYILFSLSIGVLGGIVLFARFVGWLLREYHDLTIATLAGFMIGAIRSVWPFWSYQYMIQPLKPLKGPQLVTIEPILPTESIYMASLFCLAGFAIVFIVEYIAKRKDRQVSSVS